MDLIAHGLWAIVLYKLFNIKLNKKFNLSETAFFGMFPDIFSFCIPFMILLIGTILGTIDPCEFYEHEFEIDASDYSDLSYTTHLLYDGSHSIIIFAFVFLVTWIIFKKPIWTLGAWLLHIMIDIPSHGINEWATPYLWPLTTPMINGFPWWQNQWVIMLNYYLLCISAIYLLIIIKKDLRN